MRTRIAGAITVCLSSDPPRSTLSRARTVACLGQALPPGNSPSGPLAIANRFALSSYASRVGGLQLYLCLCLWEGLRRGTRLWVTSCGLRVRSQLRITGTLGQTLTDEKASPVQRLGT